MKKYIFLLILFLPFLSIASTWQQRIDLEVEKITKIDIESVDEAIDNLLVVIDEDKVFQNQYDKTFGIWEGYTLREHTKMVLHQYKKYFLSRYDDTILPLEKMILLLALHDIGKVYAYEQGDIGLQHYYTIQMIDQHEELFSSYFPIVRGLLKKDYFGSYCKGEKTLLQTSNDIKTNARDANISPLDFLSLLIIYFQVDAGSYTRDAGGKPSLERLFQYDGKSFFFDEIKKRLIFSSDIEKKLLELQQQLD